MPVARRCCSAGWERERCWRCAWAGRSRPCSRSRATRAAARARPPPLPVGLRRAAASRSRGSSTGGTRHVSWNDAAPAARAARGSRGGTRRLPHRARGRAHGTGHVGERDRRGELRLDHPAGPAPGGTARRAGRVSCGGLYVFGGGDGVRQLDHILRMTPAPAWSPRSGGCPRLAATPPRRRRLHRLRRRRLHGQALARHHRRLPRRARGAGRGPPADRRCAMRPSPRRTAA